MGREHGRLNKRFVGNAAPGSTAAAWAGPGRLNGAVRRLWDGRSRPETSSGTGSGFRVEGIAGGRGAGAENADETDPHGFAAVAPALEPAARLMERPSRLRLFSPAFPLGLRSGSCRLRSPC